MQPLRCALRISSSHTSHRNRATAQSCPWPITMNMLLIRNSSLYWMHVDSVRPGSISNSVSGEFGRQSQSTHPFRVQRQEMQKHPSARPTCADSKNDRITCHSQNHPFYPPLPSEFRSCTRVSTGTFTQFSWCMALLWTPRSVLAIQEPPERCSRNMHNALTYSLIV